VKHEYEAKFLFGRRRRPPGQADGARRGAGISAHPAYPEIFENDALEGGAWIRLRDEGTRCTLTLKQVADSASIDGTTEIETEVTDLVAMAEILLRLGLREVRYQENYREEWRWGETAFDFDTWPGLATFVEIEGPGEASVRKAVGALGLDYSQARFGSVDEIYMSELGRDILAESTLLFASGTADGERSDSPGTS
jgi:adenylate cyclase class 2